VLVHCQMGVSRSASAVIAFLMSYLTFSYIHTLKLVSAQRLLLLFIIIIIIIIIIDHALIQILVL
jgi:hypothetical protein